MIIQKNKIKITEGFPGCSVVKNSPANAGDMRGTALIPGSGRSPGGGHSNPLQYSCLENLMDRGAWQATVHIVIYTHYNRFLCNINTITPVQTRTKSHVYLLV